MVGGEGHGLGHGHPLAAISAIYGPRPSTAPSAPSIAQHTDMNARTQTMEWRRGGRWSRPRIGV